MIYKYGLQAFCKKMFESKGKLIIIAGHPGAGKTTLMLSLILHAPGKTYMINSLKPGKIGLTQKIKELDTLRESFIPAPFFSRQKLQQLRVFVLEKQTAARCRNKLLALQRDNQLPHMLFVDALEVNDSDKNLLRDLKGIAEQFSIPVIAFCQLMHRSSEKIKWDDLLIPPLDGQTHVSELWHLLPHHYGKPHLPCDDIMGQKAILTECLGSAEMIYFPHYRQGKRSGFFTENIHPSHNQAPYNGLLTLNSGHKRNTSGEISSFLEKHHPKYRQTHYLNALLQTEDLKKEVWQNILGIIGSEIPIVYIDFTSFTPEKQEHARLEKTKSIKAQHFEWAARMRDKEKACINHLSFLQNNQIETSCFVYHKQVFYYLHLGNGLYDDLLKNLIKDFNS